MIVSSFWLGFLMGIVAVLVLLIVFAIINAHRVENDSEDIRMQEIAEGEFKGFLKEVLAEIAAENQFIIGEEVKNRDEEEKE